MNKPFEEIEFTPEDIYEELIKSGIDFELNEEYKYLETTTKNTTVTEKNNKTNRIERKRKGVK